MKGSTKITDSYHAKLLTIFMSIVFLASCSSPAQQVEVTREVIITELITQEVTRIVNIPVTVTYTAGPSQTPTNTSTPTQTATNTPSPTPFSTSSCVNLKSVTNYWGIKEEDKETRLFPTYDALDGRCVKFYAGAGNGVVATDLGWLLWADIDIDIVSDDLSPTDVNLDKIYSTVWGIWSQVGKGQYEVLLRRVEPFPTLRQPVDDGFFSVGDDFDMSAGQWKSLWFPGAEDSCYWARTNPDTGRIKDNHFGQAGVYMRVYDGDLFESDDCGPWVFVSP